MTNETAIKILQKWLDNAYEGVQGEMLAYIEGWFYDEDREAFETAIKALRSAESTVSPRIEYGSDGQPYKIWVSGGQIVPDTLQGWVYKENENG